MKKSKYKRQGPEDTENEYMWGRYDFADFTTYWRHPRTFNELRQNKNAVEDGHYVRPCRASSGGRDYLPTSWDDLTVSHRWGKCWKRFTRRKHQYGPVV